MSILTQCPRDARTKSMDLDTLEVRVPYRSIDRHVVDVPPIVPSGAYGTAVLTEASLTGPGGTFPPGNMPAGQRVGWDDTTERNERVRLKQLANELYAQANQGKLHENVNGPVKELSRLALTNLDEIAKIYRRWASANVRAAQPTTRDTSIPLTVPFKEVIDWAAYPEPAKDWFDSFAGVLRGERGGYVIGEYTPTHWRQAMIDARARDREAIRAFLREAYRALWCGEYGVAQTESYRANKEDWERGPGRLLGGGGEFAPTEKPKTPGVVVPLVPDQQPVPPDAGEEPQAGDEPQAGEEPTGSAPPVIQPTEPSPQQSQRWYETGVGKVAVGVAVVGLASWGIYRLLYRRAPKPMIDTPYGAPSSQPFYGPPSPTVGVGPQPMR